MTDGKHPTDTSTEQANTVEGTFVPSMAFGVGFSIESLVDSTENALDQASLSSFLSFVNAYAQLYGADNEKSLFDIGLVVCTMVLRGGETFVFRGLGSAGIDFSHQISVDSYQYCVDYGWNHCSS